jgi:uncharacterized protein involved in propanediol utilization
MSKPRPSPPVGGWDSSHQRQGDRARRERRAATGRRRVSRARSAPHAKLAYATRLDSAVGPPLQPAAIPSAVASGKIVTVSGHAHGHHGEIWQGVRSHDGLSLERCLLTFPRPDLRSKCTLQLVPNSTTVSVTPEHKAKTRKAIRLALDRLGLTGWGAVALVDSRIPVGKGQGSTTADIVAALRATRLAARRLNPRSSYLLDDDALARIAVEAEQASDSIMFDSKAVLFAHRRGYVIEALGEWPPLRALAFDTDEGGFVDTLAHPPARYSSAEISRHQVLVAALRRAFQTKDPALLGKVATRSAELNQRFLPTKQFDALLSAIDKCGAVGLSISHSGTVAALLFDASSHDLDHRLQRGREVLRSIGIHTAKAIAIG